MRYSSLTAIALVAILLLVPHLAHATDYVAFPYGFGGGGEADSLAFESGTIATQPYGFSDATRNAPGRKHLGAAAIVFIMSNSAPHGLNETPLSHTDYEVVGTRQKGSEAGLVFKYGPEIMNNFYAFGTAGITYAKKVLVVQSNVSGEYFTQGSRRVERGLVGGGVAYVNPLSRMTFSAEFDNRRGFSLGIGFIF